MSGESEVEIYDAGFTPVARRPWIFKSVLRALGRFVRSRKTLASNTNQNIDVGVGHYRYEHSVVAARTLTALVASSPSPPEDGEVISITVINSSGGTGLVTIVGESDPSAIIQSGYSFTVELVFDASLGRWTLKAVGDAGAHVTIGGAA